MYLKELAKEFRKLNGKTMPAEIILIGGAAVLANYGFRDMTTDIDAIIYASSAMKDAIIRVGDKYGLPNDWLNSDFMRTKSYSPKLNQFANYYRTYSNVLTIRTIASEYLIAMKLRAGRQYKNDISDIIGILREHDNQDNPITWEKIDEAVIKLYGDWKGFPEGAEDYIKHIIEEHNYENAYEAAREEEIFSKKALVDFEQDYPNVLKESNLNDILQALKMKKENSIQTN